EPIGSAHLPRAGIRDGCWLAPWVWSHEPERPVRPLAVVMVDVGAEHAVELAVTEDQEPVEALLADGAHPALGVSVRVRSSERRLDHGRAFAAGDLVEGGIELRVAIVDEEAQRLGMIGALDGQVA